MSHIQKYNSFANEDHEATENGYLFTNREESGEISHEQEEELEEDIQDTIENAILALKTAVDSFSSFEDTETGDSAEHAAKEQEIITRMNGHIEGLIDLMGQLKGEEAREEAEESHETEEPNEGNIKSFQGFGFNPGA